MSEPYGADLAAWSAEQAALLRAGRFDLIDREHVADEIEDVGKSERRELQSRLAVLLAHLLKWQAQPERRSRSWELTLREQRRMIARRLEQMPSLRPALADPDPWSDALILVAGETGLGDFPEACPWPMDDVLREGWLP